MAKAIDTEMIIQINELYKKIGTYAGVAREVGISATTVRKYVRDDYVAIADMKIKRADIGECRKIIENYTFTADALSNPNLLDNWYFADPINQRGETEYTGSGYSIDRWRTNFSGDTVAVTNNGIKNTIASTSAGWHLHQIIILVSKEDIMFNRISFPVVQIYGQE